MKKNTKFSSAFLGLKLNGNKDDLVFKVIRSLPFEIVSDNTLYFPYIIYHMKMANEAYNGFFSYLLNSRYIIYNANYQYSYAKKSRDIKLMECNVSSYPF
jgi:hypothetical protein